MTAMKVKVMLFCTLSVILFTALLGTALLGKITANQVEEELCFVIDAGHGGEDGGAVSFSGVKESELNLSVSKKLNGILGLFGIQSEMSRSSEEITYPETAKTIKERKLLDMKQRIALTESLPRPVFISIHQNKFPTAAPKGAQIFYNQNSMSVRLAEYAEAQFNRVLPAVRASKQIDDTIYIMRNIRCPAILVECGFLSNPTELLLLQTENYQTKLAMALAVSCIDCKGELERYYGEG